MILQNHYAIMDIISTLYVTKYLQAIRVRDDETNYKQLQITDQTMKYPISVINDVIVKDG